MKQQKLITPKLIRKELDSIRKLNDTVYFNRMLILMEEITLRQLELWKQELKTCEIIERSYAYTLYVRMQIGECRQLLKDLYEMRNEQ